MHIAEGFLPLAHAVGWTVASSPFVLHGGRQLIHQMKVDPESRLLIGAAGGVTFIFSALKLPSLAGSSSHPTGTGLGAVLFGPPSMALIGTIVLLFQASLLAHGGLTTLGANVFSMAIVGPWAAWIIFQLSRQIGIGLKPAAGLAAAIGDLATYLMTAFQLALAFPDKTSGVAGSFIKFTSIYAITQIPLAIIEGLVTASLIGLLATLPGQLHGERHWLKMTSIRRKEEG